MKSALQIVRSVWGDTLQKPDITESEHFFVLGGDSLLGTIAVSTIRNQSGVEVTLVDLYENPVLGKFAEQLQCRMNELAGPGAK